MVFCHNLQQPSKKSLQTITNVNKIHFFKQGQFKSINKSIKKRHMKKIKENGLIVIKKKVPLQL